MSKIELIMALLLFLLILFSMNMIFANPLKELFNNNINKEMNKVIKQTNKLSDNIIYPGMIYSGSGFLDETYSYPKGDDQPLFFGFSQK
jgi:hypothetical protein